MKVIHRERRHVCDGLAHQIDGGPWWHPSVGGFFGGANLSDGSVGECSVCGKTWVAGHAPGLVPNVWRPETRWERWRRVRRHRKAAA